MTGARAIGKLAHARGGAVAVEYGFLLALIVLAIMAAIVSLSGANLDIWRNVADKVTAT